MKPYSIFLNFDIFRNPLVRPPSMTAAAEMHLTHLTHTGLCPTSVVMFLSNVTQVVKIFSENMTN